MKTIAAVCFLLLTACASHQPSIATAPGPVNVVVTAQAPLQQSDADLFRKMTQQYVQRYVHNGRPLTVSITLGEQARPLLDRDASSNGYWLVDTSYSTQTGHPVPLVGGMTAAQVGFIPMVGGGGGGGGGSITYFGKILTAAYSITDASGKILEERSFPLCPLLNASFFVGRRLEDYHDVGVYIAKRVAKVR